MDSRFIIRRTALFISLLAGLLVTVCIAAVTIRAQQRSWQRDFLGPLPRPVKWQATQPQPKAIERALKLLEAVEPEKVVYLEKRGIPVFLATETAMVWAGCTPGDWACTEYAHSRIDISNSIVLSPRELAVVLSHEITHCQTHDPLSIHTPNSLWYRLLWRNEEATAHIASLSTARRLHLPLFHTALTAWWLDYMLYFWPAGTTVLMFAIALGLIHLLVRFIAFP
jgi:hypothetical protein